MIKRILFVLLVASCVSAQTAKPVAYSAEATKRSPIMPAMAIESRLSCA